MCQWCISTAISRHFTSDLSGDRRQFLKFSSALLAAGSAAYSIPGMAQASGPADVIFRNGSIYPISGDNKKGGSARHCRRENPALRLYSRHHEWGE
jgi:hypothetical protein